MTTSKFNILKKITLGLSTIICTCALYSNANADQEVIDNDDIIILQEEKSIDELSVNSNIDNIPNYNTENNTDEVKESAIKKFFNKKSVDRGMFALAGAAAVFGLALAGFGSRKMYSKYKANKEATSYLVPTHSRTSSTSSYTSRNRAKSVS